MSIFVSLWAVKIITVCTHHKYSLYCSDDVFEAKKVLIFGNFEAFLLKKDDLKTLRDKVMAEDMMLTFV